MCIQMHHKCWQCNKNETKKGGEKKNIQNFLVSFLRPYRAFVHHSQKVLSLSPYDVRPDKQTAWSGRKRKKRANRVLCTNATPDANDKAICSMCPLHFRPKNKSMVQPAAAPLISPRSCSRHLQAICFDNLFFFP